MNKKKTLKRKHINEQEFRNLLKAAGRSSIRDYILLFICGNFGLRVGELVRLRVSDIIETDKGKCLMVPTLKRNVKRGVVKGRIKRGELPESYEEIPFPSSEVYDLVKKYIIKFKLKNWLFPYKDSHLPEYTASRIFKKYAKQIGLNPEYGIHCLRHFKGYQIYKTKVDLKAVQTILRHKSIKTSEVYAEADFETKKKILEGIEVIF
ncbi:MAG: site-specific integrase [Roseiflexus sp.]|uniref:tyrosine-type recombinase/integrase n=1 Tax=Roseiflexus sp. TaxID=2562120 RepID=UPI0025F73BA1|nr:tyrosine-type recombinase/integrase [Roseiflexus sp.]MCL6542068.1 site-specific integrase [Roseiflexus sp.]